MNEIQQALEAIRLADPAGLLHPEAVVEAAKDEASVLHSRFEWDDTKAAAAHRLAQAAHLIRVCVTVLPDSNAPVRVYASLPDDRGAPQGAGPRRPGGQAGREGRQVDGQEAQQQEGGGLVVKSTKVAPVNRLNSNGNGNGAHEGEAPAGPKTMTIAPPNMQTAAFVVEGTAPYVQNTDRRSTKWLGWRCLSRPGRARHG